MSIYPSQFVKIGQIWINQIGYKVEVLDFGSREVWLYYAENKNKTAWDIEKFLSEYKLYEEDKMSKPTIPNHSEVAREIVNSNCYCKYLAFEALPCMTCEISKALTKAFLDGRKSGIEECIKTVYSDTQPWASGRLRNLMREGK